MSNLFLQQGRQVRFNPDVEKKCYTPQSSQVTQEMVSSDGISFTIPPPPKLNEEPVITQPESSNLTFTINPSQPSHNHSLADLLQEEMDDEDGKEESTDTSDTEPMVAETQEDVSDTSANGMDTSVYQETPLTQLASDEEVYPDLKKSAEPVVKLVRFLTPSSW